MTFAEVLFESRVVARIAAFLFFFSSALSYLPFLRSQHSLRQAASSILHRTEFLTSGYPYRGEDWGVLTVDVFANQRHLISGAGIFFVVLVFLVDFYKQNRISVTFPQNEGEEKPRTIDAPRNRNILSKRTSRRLSPSSSPGF